MTSVQTVTPKDKPPAPSRTNGEAAEGIPPASTAIDLGVLSDDALEALAEAAPKELARRRAAREEAFLKEIREQAQLLGIAPARLAAAIAGRSSARSGANADGIVRRRPPRRVFWNPADHSQTWSKRGARPKWLVEHLAAGGTEENV